MENKILKWSLDYPVFNNTSHLEIRNKPGVYRIRAYEESGKPLHIQRLGGVDSLGILHIGKSKNLKGRINFFRQSSEGKHDSHHAGYEFYIWVFKKIIPLDKLRFDYIETPTEQEALRIERLLHIEYREQFFDRPPLDSTSGKKGKSKAY